MEKFFKAYGLRWEGKMEKSLDHALDSLAETWETNFIKAYRKSYEKNKAYDPNTYEIRLLFSTLFSWAGQIRIEDMKKLASKQEVPEEIQKLAAEVLKEIPLTLVKDQKRFKIRFVNISYTHYQRESNRYPIQFHEAILPGYRMRKMFSPERAEINFRDAFRNYFQGLGQEIRDQVFILEGKMEKDLLDSVYEHITRKTN